VKIDFDQIRELLAVVSTTDITELTIESGEEKVTVRKSTTALAPPPASTIFEMPVASHRATAVVAQQAADISATKTVDLDEQQSNNGLVSITSPMVGTFYRSPSPSAPPFIDIGDRISVGQTVCIIEAMKLMNDLPAEVSGRIVRVCVENGTTVEYGQPLFMIDPKG
jgi:acetyl-CoA carboxylase biotin carboxyl carrier protein